jgi:hypothetical protein
MHNRRNWQGKIDEVYIWSGFSGVFSLNTAPNGDPHPRQLNPALGIQPATQSHSALQS